MEYIYLGDVISIAKVNRCGENNFPVLSITKSDGVVLQSEKFKKRIASKNTADYKIVHRGQLVQGIHIDEANFGIQEVADVGIVSPAYKIWDVNSRKIHPKYLEIVLRSPRSIAYYASKFNGSIKRRERLSDKDFLQMKIPCPSISDQYYAIQVLDKAASLIMQRKKQLTELDNLIKARFVEMFGNPVSNEMRWEQVPLSACVESIDNGKSFVCDSAARQGDWPAVLKLSAATYGFYRPEENKAMLDDKQFVEDAAVRVGDLLFTRKNTPELVGMCAYVYDTPRKLMMPDLIFRLNTTPNCNKLFLWKLINHDFFRECIQAIATGSAKSMSNISKERLLGLKIILPPIGLQEQFAAFVEQTDKSKVVEAIHKTNTLFNTTLNGGNRYDIRANEYKTK